MKDEARHLGEEPPSLTQQGGYEMSIIATDVDLVGLGVLRDCSHGTFWLIMEK